MSVLSGVSLTCFVASYLVALVFEASRLLFRAPVRHVFMLAITSAGLIAQTAYLWKLGRDESASGILFSSWYDWCLLGAWTLAAVYLLLAARRPQAAVGVFLLPLVLLLVGLAWLTRDMAAFPRSNALAVWGVVHGVSLLVGVVVVALGFAAGLMYLAQSWRLKHKLPPRQGFQLPSLELLQKTNRRALICSWVFIAAGLASGVVLNLLQHQSASQPAVPWFDRTVLVSVVFAVWIFVTALFELFYKPARQGRKVAYLTIFSFVLMSLVLLVVVFGESQHARQPGGSSDGETKAKAPSQRPGGRVVG